MNVATDTEGYIGERTSCILTVIVANLTITVVVDETDVSRLCVWLNQFTIGSGMCLYFLFVLEDTVCFYNVESTDRITYFGPSYSTFTLWIVTCILLFVTTYGDFFNLIANCRNVYSDIVINFSYSVTVIDYKFKTFVLNRTA